MYQANILSKQSSEQKMEAKKATFREFIGTIKFTDN